MLKNSDTTIKADLRKKSSIMDEIEYSNYNIQACMVILVIRSEERRVGKECLA